MLFSLPGSPVLYYGDEIGMGENIYLGDRNGVRTPMQWTGDRNAGFSRADPAQLHQPVILDPVFHYQAVNVEAQLRSPTSLLHWLRRLIRVRKKYAAFGRGTLRFLACENRKVVAYLREYQDQTLLMVNNLSAVAQPASLDLRPHRGFIPVELFGNHGFPRIEDQPYFLSLSPHSFYWFRLEKEAPGTT
jgi:maltose alpha-D-glucosyltransferase/alpha-amylase